MVSHRGGTDCPRPPSPTATRPTHTAREVRGRPLLPPPLSVTSRRPLHCRLLQAGPEPAQCGRDVELIELHIQQDELAVAPPGIGQRPVEITDRLDPMGAAGANDLRQFAVVPALDVIERAVDD